MNGKTKDILIGTLTVAVIGLFVRGVRQDKKLFKCNSDRETLQLGGSILNSRRRGG